MNPVLMLCRNAIELTKRAVESALAQDIPVACYVIDNASTDGTLQYLNNVQPRQWTHDPGSVKVNANEPSRVRAWYMPDPKGVSASWNFGLNYLFDVAQCEHVLVVNNDVELRNDTYRVLIEDGGQFVTAVSVGDPAQLEWDGVTRKRPHPDFSCFLIRRSVWQTVGPFDETMVLYASDGDMHLRMHRAGIEAYTIGVPFYHYASGTLKNATEDERRAIQRQADLDRDTFERKWACRVGTPEYYALFSSSAP